MQVLCSSTARSARAQLLIRTPGESTESRTSPPETMTPLLTTLLIARPTRSPSLCTNLAGGCEGTWVMIGPRSLYRLNIAKLGGVRGGKDRGVIAATFDWTDLAGHKLLTESRRMTFYADPKLRVIDFDITLTAAADAVTFGDAKDGAFGVRMRPVLQETGGTGHI